MREGTYPNPHTAGSKSQTLATQASSRNRAGRRVDRLGQIQSSIEASPEIAGLRFALVAPHFSFFSAGFASSRSRGHNRARRQTHRCPARVFLTQECSLDSRGRRSIDLQEIYSRGGQAPTRKILHMAGGQACVCQKPQLQHLLDPHTYAPPTSTLNLCPLKYSTSLVAYIYSHF